MALSNNNANKNLVETTEMNKTPSDRETRMRQRDREESEQKQELPRHFLNTRCIHTYTTKC